MLENCANFVRIIEKAMSIVVSAMYKFVLLTDYERLRTPLISLMQQYKIHGTLLLAREGINGTVAGSRESIQALYQWLASQPNLKDIHYKESYVDTPPFKRAKVKLKKEIVTMGVEGIDPTQTVGTYVKPKDWNALISDEEVTLIDTRNDYEVGIGSFKKAINPKTNTFREFPSFAKQNLDPKKHKKIAMFCTGGIRCEKSTAYLKSEGFEEVYHLEGGVLKYLEEIPSQESLWEGECFVFDDRVAVDDNLEKGSYDQCHACRFPITQEDKQSTHYQAGVSCPRCYDSKTPAQKARFEEREKQNQLAKSRGETHIGGEVIKHIEKARLNKRKKKNS